MQKVISVVGVLLAIPLLAAGPQRPQEPKPPMEMTTYYVGLIYRGPQWTPQVTPQIEQLQRDHLANIGRPAKTGKLILAGPFSDDTNLRGMFVFKVGSIEEAKALCDTDPLVRAGRLIVELHPWYSAEGTHIDPRHTAVHASGSAAAKRKRGEQTHHQSRWPAGQQQIPGGRLSSI